jgi:hypothetical protein
MRRLLFILALLISSPGLAQVGSVQSVPTSDKPTIGNACPANTNAVYVDREIGQHIACVSLVWTDIGAGAGGGRDASAYADAGAGTDASPWTGWEDAFTSYTGIVNFPTGYYSTTSPPATFTTWISVIGDGPGRTVIRTDTAPLFRWGNGTDLIDGAALARGFDIQATANLGYDNGALFISDSRRFSVDQVRLTGGSGVIGSGFNTDLYTGYLLQMDRAYNGRVEECSHQGRYTYFMEKQDLDSDGQDDSITFANINSAGAGSGIARLHVGDTHNLHFQNLKYNVDGSDDFQYDEDTLNEPGGILAGVSTFDVDDGSKFAANDPIWIGVNDIDNLELNKITSVAN